MPNGKNPHILLAQIYYPMSKPFIHGDEMLFKEAKGVEMYHWKIFTKNILKNVLKEFEKCH